jgi:hypothetical protein
MSKASGLFTLLVGAGLAVCAAGSNTNTSEPMPGPRQGQGASAMLIMGNASLATLRVGEPAEEHQGWPPSPSAAMVPAQHPAEPRGRVAIVRPEPSAPPAQDREGLTRALQRELRRLGCYTGKVDAVWNVSTRVAMKAFTDQVNARLPNDQPDHILLALARSHQDRTCVQRCRETSGLTRPGQCPSSATLTQVAGDSVTAAAVATAPPSRGEGRITSMGPRAPAARNRGSMQRAEDDRVRRRFDFASTLFARLQANLP